MSDVRQWLQSLGLGQYAEAFEENAVDEEVLADLTDEDLEKIGVKLGHRKKLLRAIAERGETPLDAPAAQPNPESKRRPIAHAERRQLSVMFCDLVGSVALGERMDVEDYRDLLSRFRTAVVGPALAFALVGIAIES